MARVVESGSFPRGSVARLVTDATAATGTWVGPTCTTSTARAARRLLYACIDADVTIIPDWVPRDFLEDCDTGSRTSAARLVHSSAPRAWLEGVMQRTFGHPSADVELFAAVNNRAFPLARHGSRTPDPTASVGDGLSREAWTSARRGWAFPPFGLLRPLLNLILSLPRPPRVACLLPDVPIARHVLAQRGWSIAPGPAYLYAPPSFSRRITPPSPLILCTPPPSHVRSPHSITLPPPAATIPTRRTAAAGGGSGAAGGAGGSHHATVVATSRGDALAVLMSEAQARGRPVALFHCVSSNLRMGAGIARQIREAFGTAGLTVNAPVTSVMWHDTPLPGASSHDAMVANLVTKHMHYDKPTRAAVDASIANACEQAAALGVRTVVTPRLACGLDGCTWAGADGVRATLVAAAARHGIDLVIVVEPPTTPGRP